MYTENTPINAEVNEPNDHLAAQEMLQLGKLYAGSQRFDEALTYYDCAIALQPRVVSQYYYRGVALFHLNRFEEALRDFERALSSNPWNVIDILNYTSCLRYRLGDTKGAREELERIISAKSGYTDGLLLNDREVYQLTAA